MTTLRVAVAGAAGRMGRAVLREALATPGVVLAGGFERIGHEAIGKDLGSLAGLDSMGLGVRALPDATVMSADAIIDFTTPQATRNNAQLAAKAGVAHIIGTTGLGRSEEDEIDKAAQKIPIVRSGNMSLGVNILCELVRLTAARLGPEYDIEIAEAHHRHKRDAPSGTAIMLGHAAAKGRRVKLEDVRMNSHKGERPEGGIGFAAIRGGGIIGNHDAIFAGAQEVVTLSHRAIDRGLFAKGAVEAARWAVGRPPGLYSMADVLGFGDSLGSD